MPAQLDPPDLGPQRLLLAGPSTMGRRSGGSVLVCLLSPPPIFFISLFCLLLFWHWGWGVATTCWLSDFWADCPLTGPSSEQRSRRGSPSRCTPTHMPAPISPEGSDLPQAGRQGLKLSSRTTLPFSRGQEGQWTSSLRASLDLLPLLLLRARLAPLWLQGRF